MRVERVTEATLEMVLPLIGEYQRFYRKEPNAVRNRRFFSLLLPPVGNGSGAQFVAFEGEMPAGFSTIYFLPSSLSAETHAVLNDLYTRPESRGRGIGRLLIAEARRFVALEGYRTLEWLTEQSNATAQRLYNLTGANRTEWLGYSLPSK